MNKFTLQVDAKKENVAFIRSCVAAFLVPSNPILSDLNDIKTAVSEAVTNCIVHGYNHKDGGLVYITCQLDGDNFEISIADDGCGIKNIEEACQPFFTTKAEEEHSGMGLTIMQTFMDSLSVVNKPKGGTVVTMKKSLQGAHEQIV